MQKLVVLIASLIVAFGLFLFFYIKPRDYESNYKVEGLDVKEIYKEDSGYYKFVVTYKNQNFEFIDFAKYYNKRNLIKKINITDKDDKVCLNLEAKHVTLYDVCKDGDNYYFANINNQKEFQTNNTYENIKIADLQNKTYLLWNYNSFIHLSPKTQSTIHLFNKDVYKLGLVYQADDYLYIPDYNSDYTFKKLYYINKNGKVKDMDLRYEVYFNSYFLGNDKHNIYLYDIKNEQEYYFDMKKEEIYKTSYKILVDNKWQEVTNQKLKNSKLIFTNHLVVDYVLEDNNLYAKINDSDIKVKASNRNISNIVKKDNMDVYYVSESILYKYNPVDGEIPLLSYSEWENNFINMIFIF